MTWRDREIVAAQLSDEWFQARFGCITGSVVGEIMPGTRGGQPLGRQKLIYRKAVEYMASVDESQPIPAKYANWGHEHEGEAIQALSEATGFEFIETGLIKSDFNDLVATSPDSMSVCQLIGHFTVDKAVEVKCPYYMNQHIKFMLERPGINLKSSQQEKVYYWQARHHMLVTGAEECIWATYHPYFKPKPLHYEIVERDENEMKLMKEICEEFVDDMKQVCREILSKEK